VALGADGSALAAGVVQVATDGGPVVPGDASRAPGQVVRGRDVREEPEPLDVTEMEARLDQASGVDDERRLPVLLFRLNKAGNAVEGQDATPRISYAGGTPAWIFSCSRTIPSITASGRGGQPGTWMSTGTILSTPWSTV
jgi:hypothetical protein